MTVTLALNCDSRRDRGSHDDRESDRYNKNDNKMHKNEGETDIVTDAGTDKVEKR